jgi:Tfp pilus assembly protein PilX
MHRKNRFGNEKGIILVAALLFLLVLTLIGISSISTSSFEHIISGNERLASTAFYAAEAGIQLGLNQLPSAAAIPKRSVDKSSSFQGTTSYVGAAHVAAYDQTWSFRRYQINSEGESGGAARQIEVQARVGPFPSGTSYND